MLPDNAKTPLYVIALLEVSDNDARHIEAIRKANDPQHGLVPPHVTFVFAAHHAEPGVAAAHVAAVAAATAPIGFSLSRAVAADDYVFLIPGEGEGGRAMRALHQALYAGPFAADFRADIAYQPHVTVGVLPTADEAAALAAILDRGPPHIAGRLGRLDLVAFDGERLETLGSFALSGPEPQD
jgi:hypothetical protein